MSSSPTGHAVHGSGGRQGKIAPLRIQMFKYKMLMNRSKDEVEDESTNPTTENLTFPVGFLGIRPEPRRRSVTVTSDNRNVGAPGNTRAPSSVAGDQQVQLEFPVDVPAVTSLLSHIEERHNDAVELEYSVRGRDPEHSPFSSPPLSPPGSHHARAIMPLLRDIQQAEDDSDDRSTTPTASEPAEQGTIRIGLGSPTHSRLGVREFEDWSAQVFEELNEALARLENLAEDMTELDPQRSKGEHYRDLLGAALDKPGRLNPFRSAVAGGIRVPSIEEHEALKLRTAALEEAVFGGKKI